MALPLQLGLESDRAHRVVSRELEAIIGELPLRTLLFLLTASGTRRLVRLEQMEFAAVARVAKRRGAARRTKASGRLPRHRRELRVLQLSVRSRHVFGQPRDAGRTPAHAATRTLG